MAGFDRALDDLFGSGRADRGMGISEYAPAFGAEELAAVEGARSRITGRPRAQVGQTGFYGRALKGFDRGIQAQADASAALSAGARGAKNAAQIAADIQIGRDRVAADRATAAAQAQARQNIAAGLGSVIDSTRTAIEAPLLQTAMKGVEEARQDRLARGEALDALVAEPVEDMRRAASSPHGLQFEGPRVSGRAGLDYRGRVPLRTPTEQLLSRVPGFMESRLGGRYMGDDFAPAPMQSSPSYVAAAIEQAHRDVDRKNKIRRMREELGLDAEDQALGIAAIEDINNEARRRELLRRAGIMSTEDMLSFGGM